jgi:hypothetical protein
MIEDSRKSIYILDNGVPVLAKQTDVLLNRPVEYKAQIELFHRLFFTLAPDDAYIKDNIQKSLYLIDDSGKKNIPTLKKKDFTIRLLLPVQWSVFMLILLHSIWSKRSLLFSESR